MNTLVQVAGRKAGLGPSNDALFAELRGTREYEQLLRKIRSDTPPVLRSKVAFNIPESDLFPEGVAADSRAQHLFLGSTHKHKIIHCTLSGACDDFAKEGQDGLNEVLGLKVDPRDGTIWAASNAASESGVFHFSVPSGKLIRKYTTSPEGNGHVFNDLAISFLGDLYVTDTRAGTVYWISHTNDRLGSELKDHCGERHCGFTRGQHPICCGLPGRNHRCGSALAFLACAAASCESLPGHH